MPRRSEGLLPVEIELRKEKASALRRVAAQLESLLAQLADLESEIAQAPAAQRVEKAREHERLRKAAEKQQWYLIVQREAIGLFNHADVFEIYPVPKPLALSKM